MSNTVKLKTCPKCNAPIPAEAPQGLCPKCVLLGAATATDAGVPATATSEIPSLERIATAFPQLEILELIGRGGMGFVFKARQPHLDRFVALKLLPDKLAKDAQFAERFNREGRVLARLNHPNIVSVFDFGQTGGFYYLLMEYVDGVNLRQAMRAGRFSPAEALSIVPKICEALQYAHEQGILHRDIKPENILLDAKGRVKIADFGIAKLVGEDQPSVTLTNTGAALGTLHYMAPEQLEKPSTVDHRADIYSLGVVFYEMLTGELPIGRFAAPSSKTPVGTSVDEVVFRTLEKDRERRFQSAGELGTTVEHLTEAGAGAAPSPLPSAEDFILCPPRLPRMAKALIIYALVAAPLLWLVSLFALPPLPEHALVAFTQGAVNLLVSVGEFLVLIVLAIGGWKLRGLRSSAPGWIKSALWSHLGTLALALAGQLFVEVLANDVTPDAPSVAPTLGDGLLLALGLVAITFEISALVWLRRHGALLRSFCKSGVAPKGPHGAMAIHPSAMPLWSFKAISSAALVGLSLLLPLLSLAVVLLQPYRYEEAPAALSFLYKLNSILLLSSIPAFIGSILGWMALSDVSLSGGRLRGAAFAVFAALAWPVLLLSGLSIWLVVAPIRNFGESAPFASFLLMLVPASLVTFIIWAIYTTTRKATGQSAPQRRGALKWIFLCLMLSALGIVLLSKFPPGEQAQANAGSSSSPNSTAMRSSNTAPMIQFTFTSVELREEAGARWLAMDFVQQVRGDCEHTFRYDARVPGFTAQTRKDSRLSDAKAGFAPVMHQRILWKLPDSLPQGDALALRDLVAKEWIGKSAAIEPGDERVLFKTLVPDGGTLAAAVGVRLQAEGASAGPSAEPEAERDEAAEVRIRLAREQFEIAQRKWAAGTTSQEEFAAAERQLVIAEARGDAVAVARANLKFTDNALAIAKKRFEAGVISSSDFRIAEGARAIAEIELKKALKNTPASQLSAFGPETGITLTSLFPAGGQLALDRKELVQAPSTAKQWGRPEMLAWLAEEGVDLAVIDYSDDEKYGWGLAMRPTTGRIDKPWAAIDAQAVKNALASPDTGLEYMDAAGDRMKLYRFYPLSAPLSFAIRTRSGRMAVLQIIGVTDNPRGVKIRYKLEQTPANEP